MSLSSYSHCKCCLLRIVCWFSDMDSSTPNKFKGCLWIVCERICWRLIHVENECRITTRFWNLVVTMKSNASAEDVWFGEHCDSLVLSVHASPIDTIQYCGTCYCIYMQQYTHGCTVLLLATCMDTCFLSIQHSLKFTWYPILDSLIGALSCAPHNF